MTRRASRMRRRSGSDEGLPKRQPDYHNLRNPFPPVPVYSGDRVCAMHEAALDLLENLGMKILLPEARDLFRCAGALVDDDTEIVRIGREIVAQAIATAPVKFDLIAGVTEKNVHMELGSLVILSGAGSPHATDLRRGRRPSSLADFREFTILIEEFDVLHMLNGVVEAQDIPPNLRHYDVTRVQLTHSHKVPFASSRGSRQTHECFEMIAGFRGLDMEGFQSAPRCYTVINTNSPRVLDRPMAQGLIDFARNGQLAVVTPFCLMGAMAPVTVAGALTLSHAEALASIALNQISKPGSPVCYGAFASNVDMKSGAPAFGTPEQVKANLGSGQLARLIGLPWRCAAGSAANINDAQAANETQMSAWGCILAGSTLMIHGAGWIEGGLSVSFEKLITDLEVMQTFAELCLQASDDSDDLALDALAEVGPGGHFFGCEHTMKRYRTAFYEPLVADWSNFGTWTERGSHDASRRALDIWERAIREFEPPEMDEARLEGLDDYIARRKAEGGSEPYT